MSHHMLDMPVIETRSWWFSSAHPEYRMFLWRMRHCGISTRGSPSWTSRYCTSCWALTAGRSTPLSWWGFSCRSSWLGPITLPHSCVLMTTWTWKFGRNHYDKSSGVSQSFSTALELLVSDPPISDRFYVRKWNSYDCTWSDPKTFMI